MSDLITELELHTRDLRVGDRLLNFKRGTSGSWVGFNIAWGVTKIHADGADLHSLSSGAFVGKERFNTDVIFKVVRPYIEVDGADLRAGDEVVGVLRDGAWFAYSGRYRLARLEPDGWVTHHVSEGGGIGIVVYPDNRYRVARRASSAPIISRWNGKCGSCGRGTYTGFLTIEHEGGACV